MPPLAHKLAIAAGLGLLLNGCIKEPSNKPTRRWPPPGSAGYQAQPRPTMVGTAVTPFGIFAPQQKLGFFQFPAQLPPLPSISDWSSLPFPVPWAAPIPTGIPAPGAEQWPNEWIAFEDEVLRQTNERRAAGAVCGGQFMGPAGPLSPHGALRSSARGHSRDMASRDYFDHTSPEGKGPSDRAVAAGYQGSFVGENIAAGQTDPSRVVQAWMESPGHCLNIMEPRYRVLGVGYFLDQNDRFGHYWTQNFGN